MDSSGYMLVARCSRKGKIEYMSAIALDEMYSKLMNSRGQKKCRDEKSIVCMLELGDLSFRSGYRFKALTLYWGAMIAALELASGPRPWLFKVHIERAARGIDAVRATLSDKGAGSDKESQKIHEYLLDIKYTWIEDTTGTDRCEWS